MKCYVFFFWHSLLFPMTLLCLRSLVFVCEHDICFMFLTNLQLEHLCITAVGYLPWSPVFFHTLLSTTAKADILMRFSLVLCFCFLLTIFEQDFPCMLPRLPGSLHVKMCRLVACPFSPTVIFVSKQSCVFTFSVVYFRFIPMLINQQFTHTSFASTACSALCLFSIMCPSHSELPSFRKTNYFCLW